MALRSTDHLELAGFKATRAIVAIGVWFAALSILALGGCVSMREVVKTEHPVSKDARLAVVWVGHATVLVQMDDKVILTDPVFTNTVGQIVRRTAPPGIDPKNLPPVDAVLISHMHFDHLSLGSLSMIEPSVRTLLMPEGGTAYLPDSFSFPVYELRTWQTWEKDGLRVTAVPVDHVGFRYGVDDAWMTKSFTGYVVEYHGLTVYFAGDSAYDQRMFVETAGRFPRIDLALLPIAPIEPRRFHMDPHEAFQAFIDLGAARLVPIHYDTFVRWTDVLPFTRSTPLGEAVRELKSEEKKVDLGGRIVAPLAIGERRVFVKPGDLPFAVAPTAPQRVPSAPPTKVDDVPEDDKF